MLHLLPVASRLAPPRRLRRGGVAPGRNPPCAPPGRSVWRRARARQRPGCRDRRGVGRSWQTRAAHVRSPYRASRRRDCRGARSACWSSRAMAARRSPRRARRWSRKFAASSREIARVVIALGRTHRLGRRRIGAPLAPASVIEPRHIAAEQMRGENQRIGGNARSAGGDERSLRGRPRRRRTSA